MKFVVCRICFDEHFSEFRDISRNFLSSSQAVFFRLISLLHHEKRYTRSKRYMENSYIGITTYICSVWIPYIDSRYDQLIDWGQAAIRIDEAYGRSEQEVLDRLPTDAATIQRMRERVCEIHRRYFATQALRLDALLEAAAKAADGKQIDRGPVCG